MSSDLAFLFGAICGAVIGVLAGLIIIQKTEYGDQDV